MWKLHRQEDLTKCLRMFPSEKTLFLLTTYVSHSKCYPSQCINLKFDLHIHLIGIRTPFAKRLCFTLTLALFLTNKMRFTRSQTIVCWAMNCQAFAIKHKREESYASGITCCSLSAGLPLACSRLMSELSWLKSRLLWSQWRSGCSEVTSVP